MLHNYIDEELNGRHYGVSNNGLFVLVQLDDGQTQVRINISPDQALHMAEMLRVQAEKVRPTL